MNSTAHILQLLNVCDVRRIANDMEEQSVCDRLLIAHVCSYEPSPILAASQMLRHNIACEIDLSSHMIPTDQPCGTL